MIHSRSVALSAAEIGLTAVMDLIESAKEAAGSPAAGGGSVAEGGVEGKSRLAPAPRAGLASAAAKKARGATAAQKTAAGQTRPGKPPVARDGEGAVGAEHSCAVSQDSAPGAQHSPGLSSALAVSPVDYKRGRVPNNPERSWEPERVQLCAQGLILRENGYRCESGVLYFVESRTRVEIVFDGALVARTLALLAGMREMAERGKIPPPLEDSPKCPRCSLVGICLPDETRLLAGGVVEVTVGGESLLDPAPDTPQPAPVAPVRRLIASGSDGRALYVVEPRAFVGKSGDVVQVKAPADSEGAATKVNRGQRRDGGARRGGAAGGAVPPGRATSGRSWRRCGWRS